MHLRGKRILLILVCLALTPMILRQYQGQEIFVGLIVLAFVLLAVPLLVVAFVLLHEGVRRAVVWMKTYVTRLTGAHNLGPREPGHPSAQRQTLSVCQEIVGIAEGSYPDLRESAQDTAIKMFPSTTLTG